MPGLLTINQVANLLSISKRTAEYWQASGRLPGFVKVYGNRRWRSDLLTRWIRDGCPDVECRSVQTANSVSTPDNDSEECHP